MHDFLILRHGGRLKLEEICKDENIKVVFHRSVDMPDGVYVWAGGYCAIFVKDSLSEIQKKYVAFHEVYHHLARLHGRKDQGPNGEREADRFAALACCPTISISVLIETVMKRYDVPRNIARVRLQHEIERMYPPTRILGGGG